MSEKVKPFVKWAGGKGSLIPQLNNFYPYELKNGIIERYIKPFVEWKIKNEFKRSLNTNNNKQKKNNCGCVIIKVIQGIQHG